MAIDVNFTHFQEVSSRNEGWDTRTHVGHSLSCCNEESVEVPSLQSTVGGDQQCLQLAHKTQRATAVPSHASTYIDCRDDMYMLIVSVDVENYEHGIHVCQHFL